VINPQAVYAIKRRPSRVLIRIRETQQEVVARSYNNGYALPNQAFIHRKHAELVAVLPDVVA